MLNQKPDDIILKAKELFGEKKYSECIEYLNSHISGVEQDVKRHARAYCLQGEAYHKLTQAEKAIPLFEKSIELNLYYENHFSPC
jgi:tetratricopeptide (TPR) repeat protein